MGEKEGGGKNNRLSSYNKHARWYFIRVKSLKLPAFLQVREQYSALFFSMSERVKVEYQASINIFNNWTFAWLDFCIFVRFTLSSILILGMCCACKCVAGKHVDKSHKRQKLCFSSEGVG